MDKGHVLFSERGQKPGDACERVLEAIALQRKQKLKSIVDSDIWVVGHLPMNDKHETCQQKWDPDLGRVLASIGLLLLSTLSLHSSRYSKFRHKGNNACDLLLQLHDSGVSR